MFSSDSERCLLVRGINSPFPIQCQAVEHWGLFASFRHDVPCDPCVCSARLAQFISFDFCVIMDLKLTLMILEAFHSRDLELACCCICCRCVQESVLTGCMAFLTFMAAFKEKPQRSADAKLSHRLKLCCILLLSVTLSMYYLRFFFSVITWRLSSSCIKQ